MEPIHIIFVNDGSSDNTVSVLNGLRNEFPYQVGIINLANNVGKAMAVRYGILSAAYNGDTDIIGFMDADLSTPLEEISDFERAFRRRNIDMVFGSRISRIGSRIQRFHYRHYFGRVIATMISLYLRIPIYDSQCGAKFFHRDLAKEIFKEPFISRWLFDVELFKRIQLSGRDIEACCWELPLDTWIEKGESKLKMKDFIKLPFEFYRILKHYRRPMVRNRQVPVQFPVEIVNDSKVRE
jgi:glycosyltransferase involved in cell wall biosynthesis